MQFRGPLRGPVAPEPHLYIDDSIPPRESQPFQITPEIRRRAMEMANQERQERENQLRAMMSTWNPTSPIPHPSSHVAMTSLGANDWSDLRSAEQIRDQIRLYAQSQAVKRRSTLPDEFIELPWCQPHSMPEAGVRFEGLECVVLPLKSIETNRVEYKPDSPEPQNGNERLKFEAFAMKKIKEWAALNKTLVAMK